MPRTESNLFADNSQNRKFYYRNGLPGRISFPDRHLEFPDRHLDKHPPTQRNQLNPIYQDYSRDAVHDPGAARRNTAFPRGSRNMTGRSGCPKADGSRSTPTAMSGM